MMIFLSPQKVLVEIISLGYGKGDDFLKSLLLEDLHKFRNGLHLSDEAY
jgi:hypothetical protein